jgi:hypothetical protein
MIVLHLEDRDVTRGALKRLLGVADGKLKDYEYMGTGIPAAAKQRLRSDEVKCLALDLNLDNEWATDVQLTEVLKQAIQRPDDWQPPAGFQAYEVTMLAKRHRVPFAVMTNYADQLGLNTDKALDGLKATFQADAAFTKDEAGLKACAKWIHETLG